MKNSINLSGRLPMFEGKYTAAQGDKKSRMNWAMNVQLNTKNDAGYYDEALVNFTAWGYYADQLQQISALPKDDATRKEFSSIAVSGRFIAGYRDKDGNIQNSVSLELSEVEFTKRLPQANSGDQAFTPASNPATPTAGGPGSRPAGGPGAGGPGRPAGVPGGPGSRPGSVPGAKGPRF